MTKHSQHHEDDLNLAARVVELKASVDSLKSTMMPREEYDRRHRRVVAGVLAAFLALGLVAVIFVQRGELINRIKTESVRADRVICAKQNEVKAKIRDFVEFATAGSPRADVLRSQVHHNFVDTPCPSLIRERLAATTGDRVRP